MASGYLIVTHLFALLSVVFGSPYGNLGCKFSQVCLKNEECRNDNLFGSCVSEDSVYSPSYDLDDGGLQQLQNGIKYLLKKGYEWRDGFSQDFLKNILIPYQSEYLDPQFAEPFQGIDTYPYQYTQDDKPPSWANDKPLFRSKKYSFMDMTTPNEGQRKETATDLLSEYIALADKVEHEREQELNQDLKDYYARYQSLLNRYLTYKDAAKDIYRDNEEYYPFKTDQDIQDKIEKVENFLQKLKSDDGFVDGAWRDEGAIDEASSSSYIPSQSASYGFEDLYPSEDDTPSSQQVSYSEGGYFLDDLLSTTSSSFEGVDDDVLHLVTDQLIPYLSEDEQEEWRKLTDAEKQELLTIVLQVVKQESSNKKLSEADMMGTSEDDMGTSSDDMGMTEDDMGMTEDQMGVGGDDIGIAGDEKATYEIDEDGGYAGIVWGDSSKEEQESDEVNLAVEPEGKQKDLFLNADIGNIEKKGGEAVTVTLPDQADNNPPAEKAATSKPHTTSPTPGYAFILFHQRIDNETAGLLLAELAQTLGLDPDTFSEIKVKDKQVTFLVNPNSQKMSAKDVASGAAINGQDLGLMMGVRVAATGLGDGSEVEVQDSPVYDNTPLVILTVILVACVLGILCAVVAIYCFRRKSQLQQKLKGLSEAQDKETEAKADYQDLCRQRMATKNSDKPEPLSRISSMAQSEGAQPSPSSRSSTSSWSEEPVQSNMDISTGHVVLSYMEDHLKNRDRLSKEWEALCTYEPDTTSTKVAEESRNASKNRFRHSLPYDHSRIVLNDTTNATGCDYINASAILDSDPKAPAYIATQAPMPNTLGDFWQMVWEQGSVVIVNLTHLSETELLQTPYWPNKGSAIYHIYELHLVSEHVWCDDYLVRSFYLKNLETQETRTVTQFHFLSWTKDGVQGSPKALLEFRRKVNKSFRGRACPIIVHCNDGIGRTGTYCLIDLVLTRMTKGAKEIDIAATLEHVRDHRPNLVNTKEQFEFALTAVAEEVNAILKALPQ